MSITAIAIAIAAIVMSALWDYAALIAIPCLAVGLILSTVDLVLNIRRAEGIRLAVAGITASIFAFLLIIVIIVPIATALPGEPHEIPPAS